MQKTAEELTVGEALKLNAVVLAVMVGGIVAIGTAPLAVEKIGDRIKRFKANRAENKANKVEIVKE
jgi:hypothetical protein